jgi:hypothetical protein
MIPHEVGEMVQCIKIKKSPNFHYIKFGLGLINYL